MSLQIDVLRQLEEARQFFANTQYSHIVKEADRFFLRGEIKLCREQLNRLPSSKALLDELVNKLKGKSIYKTLERLQRRDGRKGKGLVELKALSSLLTHTAIECEQGRLEYRTLIPLLLERLNNAGFAVLSEGERK